MSATLLIQGKPVYTREEAKALLKQCVNAINELVPALSGEQVGDTAIRVVPERSHIRVKLVVDANKDRGLYKPLTVRFEEWTPATNQIENQ